MTKKLVWNVWAAVLMALAIVCLLPLITGCSVAGALGVDDVAAAIAAELFDDVLASAVTTWLTDLFAGGVTP